MKEKNQCNFGKPNSFYKGFVTEFMGREIQHRCRFKIGHKRKYHECICRYRNYWDRSDLTEFERIEKRKESAER